MKLAYVTTNYDLYVKKFYEKNINLVQASYQEQKKALDFDLFGWADVWTSTLEPLGYQVQEIRANVQPLQFAWAREHGIKEVRQSWILDIPIAQICTFQPDVLFLDDYSLFSKQWIEFLRDRCPSIRLVMGWCGAPYNDAEVFKAYNVVLSCVPELVDEFHKMGHNSMHLNHAFDTRVLDRINFSQNKTIDFSFVGQILVDKRFHLQRALLLRDIATETSVRIFSPMAEYPQQISELVPYLKPSVFGLEMFQTLQLSKLTLNSHIGISVNHASNMRLFEATGVGTCLVTDWKSQIGELFEPDREVVVYRSAEECISKVKWLLEHDAERNAIAEAGKKRVLKDHTIAQRAFELDKLIRAELA